MRSAVPPGFPSAHGTKIAHAISMKIICTASVITLARIPDMTEYERAIKARITVTRVKFIPVVDASIFPPASSCTAVERIASNPS